MGGRSDQGNRGISAELDFLYNVKTGNPYFGGIASDLDSPYKSKTYQPGKSGNREIDIANRKLGGARIILHVGDL